MPNADSASETAPTFCWLIERGQLEGQRPNIYWTGRSDRSDRPYGDVWTENVNDAKKYPSKAAAQDALDVSYVGKWIGPATARVVEHGWFDNPLPDAVPSDAHLDVFLNKVPYDYTQDSPHSFAKRALQQWASLSLRPSLDTAPDRHSGKLWSIIRRTLSEALDAYDDTTVRMHARLDGLAAALESDVLAMFAGNSKSHLSREKVSD